MHEDPTAYGASSKRRFVLSHGHAVTMFNGLICTQFVHRPTLPRTATLRHIYTIDGK